MQNIKDPIPLNPLPENVQATPKSIWPVKSYKNLPKDFSCPPSDLFEILERRTTRRKFNKPSLQDLSTLLWFVQRHIGVSIDDPVRVKRPLPTSGALASIQTIVCPINESPWRYDPVNHRAEILDINASVIKEIHYDMRQSFELSSGTLMLFGADKELIEIYYENPESLVLRESGIILCGLSLVAEALNLSFCPLGILGTEWIESLLSTSKKVLLPAGVAILGRRAN